MTNMKTTAAVCTGLALTAGCASEPPLRVSEVTRTTDGRYALVLDDRGASPTIIPERIVTEAGVFIRAEETDFNEFFARYLSWPVPPENKLEAFGATYYKLDEKAAAKLKANQ